MTFNMLLGMAGANGRATMGNCWRKITTTHQSAHIPDFSSPGVSPSVTDAGNEDDSESLMSKWFWRDSAESDANWQNEEMVRAAGFEPATSCV